MKKNCIITTYKSTARFTELNKKDTTQKILKYLKTLQSENMSAHIVFDYENNLIQHG